MKKSEVYMKAMASVIRDECWSMADKLEILEALMGDKSSAEWSEEYEAKKAAEKAAEEAAE